MTCSDGNSYSTIGNTTFGSNSNTDQAGAKLLAGTALMAHPVMGRAGTAITTGQAYRCRQPTIPELHWNFLQLVKNTSWDW